ncbi:MAG: hypothetical protein U5K53_09830 [Halanaerobiales bacterium]|nr:hypothetical protein [Halanaerobiales bacterium]
MNDFKKNLYLQNKYKNVLLDDGGLRTLCNILTEEIGKAVFILDQYKENLLYIDRKLRKKEHKFFEYLNKRKLEKINEEVMDFKCECSNDIKEYIYTYNGEESRVLQVKLGDEETLGFLSIILGETKLDKDAYYSVMQASNAISIKLHQNNLIQKIARKSSNELIEKILTGKINKKEELIKRGELAGWDLTVSYQLFIIRFDSSRVKKDNKDGVRSLYTYELEEKVITSLHRIIRTNISKKYIIFSYNGDILLLIHYPSKNKEIKNDGKNVCKKLEEKFPKLKIMIGVGCYIEDCMDIPQSYQTRLIYFKFFRRI